ncbi:MAG: PDZ domain-containing protein [Phycisphaeraceae bacterium]|nr:PDZ domain-containing protein [Phycisphaeraceae bacterium]
MHQSTHPSHAHPVQALWRSISRAAAVAAMTVCLFGAHAQPAAAPKPEQTRARVATLSERAVEKFLGRDYEGAAALLREALALKENNFVAWYNLACCLAAMERLDDAAQALVKAVEFGFVDAHQMRRDPSLAPLRRHPVYLELLGHWPQLLVARRDAGLLEAREFFPDRAYAEVIDERLRLAYRAAFDERAFALARADLDRVAAWANRHIFPDIMNEAASRDDAWVVVVLPRREDFMRWIASVYGADAVRGNSMIGGSYEHDAKRLVSIDLGSSLRHEFMHVLHWRTCTRLGQRHPVWIQEGLCSLVEDMDELPGGELGPAPSWRTNIAKRLERIRALMPIEQLATMPQHRFTGQRPLANYSQARTVFLFVWQRGALARWYEAYTAGFAQDPTGVTALEEALGMPIADINREYRAWLRDLPMVPETIEPGKASLGIEIESGSGEGPVVVTVDRRLRNMPDSAAALRPRDVITAIDGKATRDIAELVRVLGQYNVGDEVEVSYRRSRLHGQIRVRLVAR